MITFELAKRLKEVGYRQSRGFYICACGDIIFDCDETPECICCYPDHDLAYLPRLKELIDACGKEFHTLMFSRSATAEDEYWAKMSNRNTGRWVAANGKGKIKYAHSPEEAVAQLWLALKEESK